MSQKAKRIIYAIVITFVIVAGAAIIFIGYPRRGGLSQVYPLQYGGSFNANEPICVPAMYLAMPVGSTCTIVYREYKLYGIDISKQMAEVMLTGIVSDTI